MPYPERSVLMGEGEQDAWFTVGIGENRALLQMSGATLLDNLQQNLAAALSEHAASLPADETPPSGGHWDDATARAVMLLADKAGVLKNASAYDADYIDSAWGEYYKHRWDVRLTTLAIAELVNLDVGLARAIGDRLGLPPPAVIGNSGDVEIHAKPDYGFTVELTHDAILPRWDYRPRGSNVAPIRLGLRGADNTIYSPP